MSFSIIRVQKMKSTAIKGIQFHNQREKESETNPDIKKEDSHLNYDLINGVRKIDYNQKIDQVISENLKSTKKIRKDAVRVAEFLITSDKAFFDGLSSKEQQKYFKSAHEFLAERYGEKNLVYATVHNDEKTPHMHVGLVPVTEDGRLSAKDFFGHKLKLVSLQDDFNKHLKENGFDLERGVSSSRKHLETGKYKALTFQGKEQEATQKYEQTMRHIEEIHEKTKAIEDTDSKKALGRVYLKEADYKNIEAYAINGVVAEVEVEKLKEQLKKAEEEKVQLQTEMKIGQEKLRNYYKGIEKENESLKGNLDDLATKKANEKFKSLDGVKKNKRLAAEHEKLLGFFEETVKEKDDIINGLSIKNNTLRIENNSYERENRELKIQNDSQSKEIILLKEKILEIGRELKALKERVVEVLNNQLDRVKQRLNLSPDSIKFLDEKRGKFVEESIKEMTKFKEKKQENQKEQGIER